MIMAVGVLVILATIMAFSIQTSSKTTKRVIDSYIKNQAELYAKNAAEYALYKISTSTTNCSPTTIPTFNLGDHDEYQIDIKIQYAYSNIKCPTTSDNYVTLQSASSAARSYGYAKIDVTVLVNDTTIASEPIRIFRRYLEDITPYMK